MDKVIAAINKRINPGGVKEINIRKYGTDGVEIVIPDVDEAAANRVAEMVSQGGHAGIPHFGQYYVITRR